MTNERITKKGIIITFSVKSGDGKKRSNSERVKFFKQLYGWEQTIPGKKKTYEYHREGVLDEAPHKRIDQSAFIVPEDEFGKVAEFFEQWHKKVIFNTFKVLIEEQSIFDEFDRFRREMMEEDEGNEEEDAESVGGEEDEDIDEEELTEEEKAIRKRFGLWQKAKKK